MAINTKDMRKRLEDKQRELQENIQNLTQAHPETNDENYDDPTVGPHDMEDVAVDFLESHQEQSIQFNEQALLTEVQDALKRLDDGTYGKCVVCGKTIPEKRLEAIPWAARCIEDEEKLENRNLSREELYDTDAVSNDLQ